MKSITKQNISIEEEIEQAKIQSKTELDLKIERIKLSAESQLVRKNTKINHAKENKELKLRQAKEIKEFAAKQEKEIKDLEEKQSNEKSAFEIKYKTIFGLIIRNKSIAKKQDLSIWEKQEILCKITNKDGQPKYKLSENGYSVIGTKGEEISTTVYFKDSFGNKQSLSVDNLSAHLQRIRNRTII